MFKSSYFKEYLQTAASEKIFDKSVILAKA